ncbi:CcdC family protein [Paenibacillus sp. L3-i20]|uniref:CcdC family protein n=1 Tax=Paenibacillus sp. L3-i20 TaxID=2905833 RepID=UPI001EDE3672|nr:cytochrome c biogenesis protein CcdC [Paenibacillus sp. L3-i20]GKU77676.1 CcdC family protein [Paenibacillus sp. L3-i20]
MQWTNPILQLGAISVSIIMGLCLIIVRIRAGNQPTTLKKIVIPPLGMATGFIMFAFPMTHIPWLWGVSAFGTGLLLFAFPLIVTTRLERVDTAIFVRRSKAFVAIIIVMFLLRIMLHRVVEHYVTIPQTGAIFYLLALGMIIPWRLAMVSDYLRLRKLAA